MSAVDVRRSERGRRASERSTLAQRVACLALVGALAASCALVERPNARRAVATFGGATSVEPSGVAVFVAEPGGVRVSVTIQNASPGEHGVFVCEPSRSLATSHFNPRRAAHGSRAKGEHHAGDLGNVSVDEHGLGTLEVFCDDLSINDPATTVVGKSLVITDRPDDFTTQPNGASGVKIASGEILADRR
jgi:Cu-Zn family superoxide dismutase